MEGKRLTEWNDWKVLADRYNDTLKKTKRADLLSALSATKTLLEEFGDVKDTFVKDELDGERDLLVESAKQGRCTAMAGRLMKLMLTEKDIDTMREKVRNETREYMSHVPRQPTDPPDYWRAGLPKALSDNAHKLLEKKIKKLPIV